MVALRPDRVPVGELVVDTVDRLLLPATTGTQLLTGQPAATMSARLGGYYGVLLTTENETGVDGLFRDIP